MSNENIRVATRVKVGGKFGTVINIADKYQVKFEDGSFGFFNEKQLEPSIEESYLKGVRPDQVLMEPTAAGEDPLAQPKRATDRSIGEDQTVLGKSATSDRLI